MSTVFCIDLDGTLCTNTFGEYEKALPVYGAISKVNSLYQQGNTIKIFTARGSGSGKDWRQVTESQLKDWQVQYHELIIGKPEADFYIDDRGINVAEWLVDASNSEKVGSDFFHNYLLQAISTKIKGTSQISNLVQAADLAVKVIMGGGTVYWCGNGGSAADSQHLAAELVGRFAKNRAPLSSIALTTDTSVLTALANDYGYESTFSRQLEALGKPGDLIFGISTSGNSKNVIEAFLKAKQIGISTISLTGISKCDLDELSDISLKAQSTITAHIQESHITWGQAICGYIENQIFPNQVTN